jgi:predicted O-methyltransferase YrrM
MIMPQTNVTVAAPTHNESENDQFLRFAPPGHFYSPIPDIREIRLNSAAIFDRSVREIPGVELNDETQLSIARKFSDLYSDMPFTERKADGRRYYLDNDFFSYGDGISLYSMIRLFSPKRIIEIGSGFSSALMLDVDEIFFKNQLEFTFIEPYPDRLHSLITNKDKQRSRILEKSVQQVPPAIFRSLRENDILFIDSSHVAKTHSDVLHILFNILPLLRKEVLIHFHDILWPFEYPRIWLEHGRAWNEAYFIRAFMQYNKSFEILYFNSFMEFHHKDLLTINMPLMVKAPSAETTPGNTSLWIRKTQ